MIEIRDFKKVANVPQEIINKYENILSEEIIEFWKDYGLGTFFEGFMKSINPEEYTDLMEYGTQFFKDAVPLFVTGLGDIIYVEKKDGFMGILKFRYKETKVLMQMFNLTIKLIIDENDKYFCDSHIEPQMYFEALKTKEEPAYDECFGYVPILPLGGKEEVAHMNSVKIREHILLITELTGPIND